MGFALLRGPSDSVAFVGISLRPVSRPKMSVRPSGMPLMGTLLSLPQPLLLDSGVLADQQRNERTKQRFASLADVVNKLEETQVEREFLL